MVEGASPGIQPHRPRAGASPHPPASAPTFSPLSPMLWGSCLRAASVGLLSTHMIDRCALLKVKGARCVAGGFEVFFVCRLTAVSCALPLLPHRADCSLPTTPVVCICTRSRPREVVPTITRPRRLRVQ